MNLPNKWFKLTEFFPLSQFTHRNVSTAHSGDIFFLVYYLMKYSMTTEEKEQDLQVLNVLY